MYLTVSTYCSATFPWSHRQWNKAQRICFHVITADSIHYSPEKRENLKHHHWQEGRNLSSTMKMDLIYWWRHSGRPAIYSPVSLTKFNCAKCHCSLWPMMGNVRCGISLSLALFTISYFTERCALSERPNKSPWNQQLCHSHSEIQWTACDLLLFQAAYSERLQTPHFFPNQTSNSPLVFVLTITANKLILSQIYAKDKDWSPPLPSPSTSPQGKRYIIC